MTNPPFPYNVIIRRRAEAADPFIESEEDATVVYEGICDYENNRYPIYKEGVQIAKYKLYLPYNTIGLKKEDLIELDAYGVTITGEVVDVFPTNFGLTVTWSSSDN